MATEPFVDANISEVLARVGYRYIDLCWRRRLAPRTASGASFVTEVVRTIPGPGFGLLRGHLTAMANECQRGTKLLKVRNDIVARSRYGLDWRRCLMPVYKANRKSDPRVTNRGVTTCDDIYRRENSPLAKDFSDE